MAIGIYKFLIEDIIGRRKKAREEAKGQSFDAYLARFDRMQDEGEAEYGDLTELQRPEMEPGDDPAIFNAAWKQFKKNRETRRKEKNPPWRP